MIHNVMTLEEKQAGCREQKERGFPFYLLPLAFCHLVFLCRSFRFTAG
jgi:hypothetical protein